MSRSGDQIRAGDPAHVADGDDIRLGNVTDSKAVAAGRGAMAANAEAGATVYQARGDLYLQGSKEETRDRRRQIALLSKVEQAWIEGVLERSLHQQVLIELGKEPDADALVSSWDVVLEGPLAPPRRLPVGTSLLATFEAAHRALLILGAPGAGKTITLLALAREAISRVRAAPADPERGIPVVLNLSSWAREGRPLGEWAAQEIAQAYAEPRDRARGWIDAGELLLLLDGLDEIEEGRRAACVEAINTFHESHGDTGLVVCCRRDEYEALPERLALGGAIVLQPLTLDQVDHYLDQLGPAVGALRAAVGNEAEIALRELAATPLWLHLMVIVYRDAAGGELPGSRTTDGLRRHLFGTYVDRMLDPQRVRRRAAWQPVRPGLASRLEARRYSREQATRWLAWLAGEMVARSQTVLYLELLPSGRLPTPAARWLRRLGRLAVGLLIALVLGLEGGLVTWLIGGLGLGLTLGLAAGLCLGLVGGLGFGLLFGMWNYLLSGQALGRVGGLEIGNPGNRVRPNEGISRSGQVALRFGLVGSLAGALVLGPVGGLVGALSGGLAGALADGLAGALNGARTVGMTVGLASGLQGGLVVGLILALASGGATYLDHMVLRFALRCGGLAPLRYVRFLDYCVERILLQRVGGGYIFVHRLLMEYFASLYPEQPDEAGDTK